MDKEVIQIDMIDLTQSDDEESSTSTSTSITSYDNDLSNNSPTGNHSCSSDPGVPYAGGSLQCQNSLQPDLNPPSLITTLDKTNCSFCSRELNPGDGIMLSSCLHNYCRDCIITSVEQSSSTQISCPISHETGCNGILLDHEVKALISPESYQKFLQRSIITAEKEIEDVFSCRNPDCSAVFSIPTETKEFKCIQCDKINCIKCKELKEGDLCKCRKRHSTNNPELCPNKMTKIDEELKKDWEATWTQLEKSFNAGVQVSAEPSLPHASCSSQFVDSHVLNTIEQTDLLLSTKTFDCIICFCNIPIGQGVILKDCLHLFCRDCLIGTIENSEQPQVKCPFQINDFSCQVSISDREIKALLSEESHEKFLRRSVTQAEMCMGNSFHCKTVNCHYWLEVEEGTETTFVICPVCNKKNCLKCKAIHEAIPCLEYQAKLQEDEMDGKTKKMIHKLIETGKAMKCPTCKIIIQKTSGCDGMQCSVCKTHICWATKGPRWGPRGVGDTSGGCHCREKKGKRCDPKCRNCH